LTILTTLVLSLVPVCCNKKIVTSLTVAEENLHFGFAQAQGSLAFFVSFLFFFSSKMRPWLLLLLLATPALLGEWAQGFGCNGSLNVQKYLQSLHIIDC